MAANHERFADQPARLALHGDQALGLARTERDRLLAQQVLGGVEGARRPFDVHMVG
jgi:hypothetical protein